LENLELDIDALRHVVIHRLDGSWDCGEGNGTEGDEALERAKGDRDHFGVFRRAAHEYRAKEVFRVPAILPSKERTPVSEATTMLMCKRKNVTYLKPSWQ